MAVETAPHRDPFALSEEERLVRDTARDWAQREVAPGAAQRDEEERYDRSLFERAGELGLTGIPYPEEYGGAGMGTFAWVLAAEEVAAADMGMAVSLSVHVLSQLCIFANGTEEQKQRFLPADDRRPRARRIRPDRAAGRIGCRRPRADRHPRRRRLPAHRHEDLDHECRRGGAVVVFGTVDRSAGKAGITAFVVEADTPGFRLGSKERKMGIRGTTGYELVFEERASRPRTDSATRAMGCGWPCPRWEPAASASPPAAPGWPAARSSWRPATPLQRRQFGRAIADQEMIQGMLAEMATGVDAARLLTWRAARQRDAGQPINAPSSMAKWHASDVAMRVTTDAVQIYGGAGYSRDNPVERLMRDAKGAQIYEGTNQIHRLIVAQHLLDGMRRGDVTVRRIRTADSVLQHGATSDRRPDR